MALAFSQHERRLLLSTRGIGETVVHRLEAAGYGSLHALREAGAAQVTEVVLSQLGSTAWRNRRRAIERALAQAVGQGRPTQHLTAPKA